MSGRSMTIYRVVAQMLRAACATAGCQSMEALHALAGPG